MEQFDREIYGRVPANVPKVNWEVVGTTNEIVGGMPAITKTLLGHVDNSAYPLVNVDIQLSVTVPANAAGPVPVMMEFGFPPELMAMLRRRLTPAQLAAFEGTGVFLLGAVLEQFFARYVSLNSFTETIIHSQQRGEIIRWPAQVGRRQIL